MRALSCPARLAGLLLGGFALIAVQSADAAAFQISNAAEFSKIIDTNTAVLTTNATASLGAGTILEGPVWVPGSPGYLLFSIFTYLNYADTGAGIKKVILPNTVTNFLMPPAFTVYNGTTLDSQERLIACQSGTAGLRVVMITNNVVTTLATNCAGLKFYSPNDVVVKSDGTIWFTDPGFNGNTANPPQAGYQTGHWVYRFNPTNGNATCVPVITNVSIFRPNGLCFSPDERILYLADYDARAIRSYSVTPSNTLTGGSVFATLPVGNPDGIRCDVDGRVYSSSSGGIYIYLPNGNLPGILIGRINTPNGVANLCFGGTNWQTLFITAAPNVLSIQLKVAGAVAIRKLVARGDGENVLVSWPSPSTGFTLRASDFLGDQAVWTTVEDLPQITNGMNVLNVPATNAAKFFRLQSD